MTFRFASLVPAIALLTAGAVHAQGTGGGGQMAYPDSLASGQVKIPAPTARDTGSMGYPASPGGVQINAPDARDTGNMGYPNDTSLPQGVKRRAKGASAAAATAAAPAAGAPAVTPTPAGMKAAAALADAPGSAPVPYVDFPGVAGKPMHEAGMHHMPMHHTAVKKAADAK